MTPEQQKAIDDYISETVGLVENNKDIIILPLTAKQMERDIQLTNHSIVTSYIEAALAVGPSVTVKHYLEMALAAQKL